MEALTALQHDASTSTALVLLNVAESVQTPEERNDAFYGVMRAAFEAYEIERAKILKVPRGWGIIDTSSN